MKIFKDRHMLALQRTSFTEDIKQILTLPTLDRGERGVWEYDCAVGQQAVRSAIRLTMGWFGWCGRFERGHLLPAAIRGAAMT
eukprot:scaffold1734_cov113-Isochrysis_galbana.AAC.34